MFAASVTTSVPMRLPKTHNRSQRGLNLTNQHTPGYVPKIARLPLDGTSVYPRVVVRRALGPNAAALACAHNHTLG